MTVPVRCRVPASFRPVDLAGGEEFARQLLAVNAGFAAVFVAPPGQPGYFAITEPTGVPPDLDGLADNLAVHPDADVRQIELPCGPAVTCVEYARVGQPRVDVVQEHAFAVHPATGTLVAFTLGVHDAHRRPEYAHLFGEILRTVVFPVS
jgi:hypothetical protein